MILIHKSLVQSLYILFKNGKKVIKPNINLNVIKDNILKIKDSLIDGGEVLFSGIMETDEVEMLNLLKENSFKIVGCFAREGWLVIHAIN